MDKLSIFGGTGFVGGHFANLYNSECDIVPRQVNVPLGDDVVYFISTTHNYNVFDNVHIDIDTNLNKLMDVLPNVKGTFNFVSSWFVYGFGYDTEATAAKETDVCRPKGFYSITKKAAEDLIVSYCSTFNKRYRIIRLCNVIGGDRAAGKKKNALEFLINKIVNGEDVDVYVGDNYRSFMHANDVCRAINLVRKRGELDSIYNVGNGTSYRLIDIVEYVIKKTGSKSKVNYVEAPRFHKNVQSADFFMNCDKIENLGFEPYFNVWSAVGDVISRTK